MNEAKATHSPRPYDSSPITVILVLVYAFVFAGFFLLYGGVKVVLSFLDHNYADLTQPIIFVVFGLILLAPAFAFRELKRWGFWGLVVVNGLVVILAAIGYNQHENIVVMVFSGIALYALFAPATTEFLAKHR